MRSTRRHAALPIGRAARVAYEIETMRTACCKAAEVLVARRGWSEEELEECARLDDALAQAHRLLKSTVRSIMMTRLARRSRAR